MTDKTVRGGPERSRIKTLTQAALNADKTVEQVEDVLESLDTTLKDLNTSLTALNNTVARLDDGLDHLEGTLSSLDELARRLGELAKPAEAIGDRIEDMVSVAETLMSPLSATEHAVRGVLDRLRNRSTS